MTKRREIIKDPFLTRAKDSLLSFFVCDLSSSRVGTAGRPKQKDFPSDRKKREREGEKERGPLLPLKYVP